jgi:hypothetical protein
VRTLRDIALAAGLLLIGGLAHAQVYSWKDPGNGATRFSNIPPYWYRYAEPVSGPRVIVTVGDRVVDDTALSFEDRLLLSGKTRDQIEKLRQQWRQTSRAPQDPVREPRVSRQAG